ncbi:MAG: regulatory protein GemA [Zoogloeaceae bacterium]|jgi:hypothetical protein|nr:regulatory protein GemA [Zoogloeaceae bacterium]
MPNARHHQASGYRAAALRAVFAACRANHIDEDMRHDIVQAVTGKASLKDCSSAEIGKVLDRLNHRSERGGLPPPAKRSSDGGGNEWRFVFSAAQSRQPYLKKIYRLAEVIGQAQTPPVPVMPKHYIEGMAGHMAGLESAGGKCVKRLEFCDVDELMKIIQGLAVFAERHDMEGLER